MWHFNFYVNYHKVNKLHIQQKRLFFIFSSKMQHEWRICGLEMKLLRQYFNIENSFHFDIKSVTLHYKCKYYTLT